MYHVSYLECKQHEEEKEFLNKLAQKQGRYKLKEYAKHIQQINQRNIKLAKQRELEKERQFKIKQKEKAERKKRLEEQKLIKKQQQKEQIIKNRRRRNSLEIQQINKKVSELAALQMKRIKSGKLLQQTQKQIKKMKLQQLDQKRKNILSKTRKIPIQPSIDLIKQNKDNNIMESQSQYRKDNRHNYSLQKQTQIIRNLEKQGIYDYQIQPNTNYIKQESEQEDCTSEQQDEDQDFNYQQVYKIQQSQEKQTHKVSIPIPIPIPTFQNKNKQQIAKLLNSQDEQESQIKGFDQQIFFLSSEELCNKAYLKI